MLSNDNNDNRVTSKENQVDREQSNISIRSQSIEQQSIEPIEQNSKSETIEIDLNREDRHLVNKQSQESIAKSNNNKEEKTTVNDKVNEKPEDLSKDVFVQAVSTTPSTKKSEKKKETKCQKEKLNAKIKVYEPKRNYEPMLSIDRLLKSHLTSKVKDRVARVESRSKEPAVEEAENMGTVLITPEAGMKTADVIVNHVTTGIPEWMVKPKDKVYKKVKVIPGLECIEKLRKFYIYDNIRIIDTLFNKVKYTKNCMTIRNADYQQLFYVGSEKNRQNDVHRPFTLRLVDQYCRYVVSVKKLCRCICFGRLNAHIECPPGKLVGHLKQQWHCFSRTVEFSVIDPNTKKTRFTIRRLADATVRHEFDILNDANESIGTILKRFEKINLNNVLEEDHCVRVGVPQVTALEDKVLIITSALIINIFFLRQFKIAYPK